MPSPCLGTCLMTFFVKSLSISVAAIVDSVLLRLEDRIWCCVGISVHSMDIPPTSDSISLSEVIFFHSGKQLEIFPALKLAHNMVKYCFSSGTNFSQLLLLTLVLISFNLFIISLFSLYSSETSF